MKGPQIHSSDDITCSFRIGLGIVPIKPICHLGRSMETYMVISADGREYGPATVETLRRWQA
ncbi:hypothetical protein ABTM57_20200, partial [Acinetobacter baumannii]